MTNVGQKLDFPIHGSSANVRMLHYPLFGTLDLLHPLYDYKLCLFSPLRGVKNGEGGWEGIGILLQSAFSYSSILQRITHSFEHCRSATCLL